MPRLWSRRELALGFIAVVSFAAALPGATAAPESPLARESRLDTRLTLRAPGIALRDLLPRISRSVGVNVSAAPDVADQKIILFGPARPAREALEDLAALLDLRWERVEKAGGAIGYRLGRSPQAAQRDAALEAAAVRRIREAVDEHARALADTPEQLERRGDKDFAKVFLADPEFRPATEFYALLSSRQKEELFTRKRLLFSLPELGPQLQAPLRRVYAERIQREEEFFNSPDGQELLRKAGPAAQIQRHRPEDLEQNAFRMQALRTGGFISVGMNLGSAPTAVSVTVNEEGQHSFSTNGWPITLLDTATLWILPAHGNPYGAAEENAETIRSFGRAAADQKAAGEWVDRLKSLAERAGKPVVADYYRGALANQSPALTAGDAPRDADAQNLDRFCASSQYLWWTRGSSLLLRKRDWYVQAAYEVPDIWYTRLVTRLRHRSGAATSGDLAIETDLPAAQLDGLAALAQGRWVADSSDGDAILQAVGLAHGELLLRDLPLPSAEPPAETRPLTVSLEDLPAPQRQQAPSAGRAFGWMLTPEEIRAFRLQINGKPRQSAGDFQYLPVQVRCEFGPRHQAQATLYLPMSVPHDRRGELVVEAAP